MKINDQLRRVHRMDSPPNDLIDLSVTVAIARENMMQDKSELKLTLNFT